jgi:hypothetical protein
MGQDLGLKIAEGPHWEGLNGDGMTSTLFIYTFLSGVAEATGWN